MLLGEGFIRSLGEREGFCLLGLFLGDFTCFYPGKPSTQIQRVYTPEIFNFLVVDPSSCSITSLLPYAPQDQAKILTDDMFTYSWIIGEKECIVRGMAVWIFGRLFNLNHREA